LRRVPNGVDGDVAAINAVKDEVRSAAYDQFTDSGFGASTAEVWISSEGFDQGDDADGQALGGLRFIQRDVSADLLQSREG
jgi:hypothetical protein